MEGHVCIPMTAGGHAVGVLGLPETAGPFTENRWRVLAATAALLGIALRNAQLFQEMREHSLRDGLTGCFNRTHALEVLDVELRRARRSRQPLSLIMFDLDHFKDVNDRYGHLCGDAVLAAVGVRMRDVLRGSDLKCRYGSEEFLVLLPETPLEGATRVADSLRRELAGLPIHWKDETLSITASFGVTMALPSEIDSEASIGGAGGPGAPPYVRCAGPSAQVIVPSATTLPSTRATPLSTPIRLPSLTTRASISITSPGRTARRKRKRLIPARSGSRWRFSGFARMRIAPTWAMASVSSVGGNTGPPPASCDRK